MGAMASRITSLTIVYSTVYSDADQRKRQSYALLAFVRGIHHGPVHSPHKWPVTWKMSPFNDVIMEYVFGFKWQLVACLGPYHCLNQWCLIVIWTLGIKLLCNCNRISDCFIEKNAFHHAVKMLAISSWPQWSCGTIWCHKFLSTLAQVMACCLVILKHYVNPCWFIISRVLCHSPKLELMALEMLVKIIDMK